MHFDGVGLLWRIMCNPHASTLFRKDTTMLPEIPLYPECFSDALLLDISDDLTEYGWSQQNFFLPEDLTIALAAECHLLSETGTLQLAGTGRGAAQALRLDIRSD